MPVVFSENLNGCEGFAALKKAVREGACPRTALFGLPYAALAHTLSCLFEREGRAIAVTASERQASALYADLSKFIPERVCHIPSRDFVFNLMEGAGREYELARLSAFGRLVRGDACVAVCSVEAALAFTMPPELYKKRSFELKEGESFPLDALCERLVTAGYVRAPKVEGRGQFSVRGGIVDIFPADLERPARMEYWGDEVTELYAFDADSQRRSERLESLTVTPAREIYSDHAALRLREFSNGLSGRDKEAFDTLSQNDLERLEDGVTSESLDRYLACFYKKPATAFDYLPRGCAVLCEPFSLYNAADGMYKRHIEDLSLMTARGETCRVLGGFYASPERLTELSKSRPTLLCDEFPRSQTPFGQDQIVELKAFSPAAWNGASGDITETVKSYSERGISCAVMAGTEKAAHILGSDLAAQGFSAVKTMAGTLSAGIEYPDAGCAIITLKPVTQTAAPRRRAKKKGTEISSIEQLSPGEFLVHENHGIGIYRGIRRMEVHGTRRDYITIEYRGGDRLYVPVTSLHMVTSYCAPAADDKVKINKLYSGDWAKTKQKVYGSVKDMAKELIELYAKRAAVEGYAFPPDDDWQRDFETRFEYDETGEQLVAASDIKRDMEKSVPMDRLLCGDVGVGKTEVALRAAFKCVTAGKQCAILAPTTILANQHYNTILSRMGTFPVETELLSRFRSKSELARSVKNINSGKTDIAVGTHRLLQKDIKFKNLGLVIIDEEQRFGVAHKEKLKQLFPNVDVLSLSATPIPRTLNMAMSGIRDLSIIEEPPLDRLPVQTYVTEFSENLIGDAIRRELARGGQVYYLHNAIESIERAAAFVREAAPGANIMTAHGRMDEGELSRVWEALVAGECDVLVCTTIIETGVDVPNCNTLIVENADRFGLSQLYQLRGRVGRSDRRAYAYFTFRRDGVLTDIAAKRLDAIREFVNFGSGIKIAMRDLQIRGAGSLLGARQHGNMTAVGYDTYMKLLADAVGEVSGKTPEKKKDCVIDINIDAYIPDDYIEQTEQRIEVYKDIASITTEQDAEELLARLRDIYGELPDTVTSLVAAALCRINAAGLGFYEAVQRDSTLYLYTDSPDIEAVRRAIALRQRHILYSPKGKQYVSMDIERGELPVDALETLLKMLTDSGWTN